MKLIIIGRIERLVIKMEKMTKFGSTIHSIGALNEEKKLELKAKMVKFASQDWNERDGKAWNSNCFN